MTEVVPAEVALPRGLQSALKLPLIETLDALGGRAKPGEIYEAIAAKLGLSSTADSRVYANGKTYNTFEQQVRWTRQTAVADELISKETRGVWTLTKQGRKFAELHKIKPGKVILLYRRNDGIALCAHAEDAASLLGKASVDLILTSPPYPIVKRAYGQRFGVVEWLAWMTELMGLWRQLVTEDGTIAINLMDVHAAGSPNLEPYVERLTLEAIDAHDLKLAGRLPWASASKLGHIEWSSKRHVRPRNVMEHILLFSPSDHPAWDAQRLPQRPEKPRSASKIASDARRVGKSIRPSGLDIREDAFGSLRLADNLIQCGGASGADVYSRACRSAGLPIHPARFPAEIPKRVILLTTEVNDLVYDPMSGSGATAAAAHELGRRWITSDPILEYGIGSEFRFPRTEM